MTWNGQERRASDRTTAAIRRSLWGGITWHPFESFVAVLILVAGIGSLLHPNPVVPESPAWISTGISIGYATSGATILIGLWRLWPTLEGLGLLIFSTTAAAALLTLYVFMGAGGMPIARSITFTAAIAAAMIRIAQILKRRQLIQVEPT